MTHGKYEKGYVVVNYDSTVVKNASDVCKRSSTEYVRMGIYTPNSKWISLGYPRSWLDKKGKKTYCTNLEFKDENGNLINSFITYSFPKGNGYATMGQEIWSWWKIAATAVKQLVSFIIIHLPMSL